jgi:hypothetical protein
VTTKSTRRPLPRLERALVARRRCGRAIRLVVVKPHEPLGEAGAGRAGRRWTERASWSAARGGHGPIGSVMLGSVSTGVIRKARCPILVIPRGGRDGFAALQALAAAAS